MIYRTGCAEKKISFCERMAPQTMAASYQMSVRLRVSLVTPGRTYNPNASLRNSCSTCGMSDVYQRKKVDQPYLSRGCDTTVVLQADSRRLYVLEVALLHSVRALQLRSKERQSLMPWLLSEMPSVMQRRAGRGSSCESRKEGLRLGEGPLGLKLCW